MGNPTEIQIITQNGKPCVSSLEIADKFGKRHDDVLKSIRSLLADVETDFGLRNFAESSYLNEQNKSQPMVELTRDGFALLAMGFTGKKAISWKIRFVDAFNRMEQHILQNTICKERQSSLEWKEARIKGFEVRKDETNIIQKYVEYAIGQGSKSAQKYYMIITKMENAALFILDGGLQKSKNLRNTMTVQQLAVLNTADKVVAKALVDGMGKGLHYKEIFQLAKERMLMLSSIVGKSAVPLMLESADDGLLLLTEGVRQ